MYNALVNTVGSVALRQNADKFPVPAIWSPFTHKPHSVNSGVSIGFDSVMSAYGELSQTVVLSGDFVISGETSLRNKQNLLFDDISTDIIQPRNSQELRIRVGSFHYDLLVGTYFDS